MIPRTIQILLVVASIGAAAFRASGDPSNGQDPAVFKSEVSRAAVTKMPAYTVEEPLGTKTHTLFMGADIAINLDKSLYKVRDVFGSNWVIDINGREKEISAKRAPLDLKITPTLKLTEASVTIAGFKRVKAYSYANDPSVLLTRGLTKAASISSDLMAIAQNAQARSDTSSSHSLGGAAYFAGSDDQFSANAMLTSAEYMYSNSHPNPNGGAGGPSPTAPTATKNTSGNTQIPGGPSGFQDFARNIFNNTTQSLNNGIAASAAANATNEAANGNEAAGKIATGGLDALDVEFDIRSAKPLHEPYIVTMTRFRAPGAKSGMVQNMVYAQSIHPIDEHLSHVHFVEEGFPFGYDVLDFQLHVYNQGEEIASNIAADRVELTRDEAFEYVKMEYVGAHKKDTLPAAPVMGKLPYDLPMHLAAGKYRDVIYVRVSPDGTAFQGYSDPACTNKINDDYLDSVIKRIRFNPALSAGKPVDGVAAVNLGKLAI